MTKIPCPSGRGFVTDYLPGHPDSDWECVFDFCGRVDGEPCVNICAWWSPSRGITSFGGQWRGVPDLPYKASEDKCWRHGMEHSIIGKRLASQRRKKAYWEARSDHTDRIYKELGSNSYKLELRLRDGTLKSYEGACGIHGTLSMLRIVAHHLGERGQFAGAVIKLLKVTNSKGNPTTHDLCLPHQNSLNTGRS